LTELTGLNPRDYSCAKTVLGPGYSPGQLLHPAKRLCRCAPSDLAAEFLMNKRITLIPAIILGLCTVLFVSQKVTAAEMGKEAQELAKLDDQWSAAAGTRDAAKVAAYYSDDAMVYPPNDVVAVGREKAQEAWAAMLADPSLKIS
jgi:hypothetical protein